MKEIPVIDLFAGAGGLSEGFSRFESESLRFDLRLSIEKEAYACETLKMRAFFQQFRNGVIPEFYYDAIRGDRYALERIYLTSEWQAATARVRQWTLGEVSPTKLHSEIRKCIGNRRDWILLGGPPCQAYSVIGRARRTGAGARVLNTKQRQERLKAREQEFAADHRHTLYREYLQIVAVQQPAVFVMENVKGVLSSQLHVGNNRGGNMEYEPTLVHMMADLRDPWRALQKDRMVRKLRKMAFTSKCPKYRLMSFVTPAGPDEECNDPAEFIIRCERYGIPQARHRFILLGVREDLNVSGLLCLSASDAPVPAKTVLKGMPKLRSALSANFETRFEYGHDDQEAWRRAVRGSFPKGALTGINKEVGSLIQRILATRSRPLSRGGAFVAGKTDVIGAYGELREWIKDERLGGAIQHESRAHMASDLGRYLYCAAVGATTGQSPKINQWPKLLLPEHENVRGGKKRSKTVVDGFNDRFRVQVWGKPSTTITSHISKDGHAIIHPDPMQCRSLTVRETARLQTFPDNYYFCGNRTEQYLQVGNAAPPFLAFQLAEVVAGLLVDNSPTRMSGRKKGQKKRTPKVTRPRSVRRND